MNRERKRELTRFISVGLTANGIDYAILNTLSFVFGAPLLLANIVSATLSSIVSYKLQKKIVFHDRMHGRFWTLALYAAIIGFGVVAIQSVAIHVMHAVLSEWFHPAIALNLAKAGASFLAFLWNYSMVRRFIFVTKAEVKDSRTEQ